MKKIAIVGAGITGVTLANLLHDTNDVTVFEQSNHIGGSAYDEYNEYGVLVQKYGIHIFHTSNKEVMDYLRRFADWRTYIHRVASCVHGTEYVGVPFAARGNDWDKETYKKYVVDKFNEKRWCTSWENLPDTVKNRLDFTDNTDFNDWRYFSDTYQGVPIGGYTQMFTRMLDGIEIRLNSKFTAADIDKYDLVIYTGCADYLLDEISPRKVSPLTYIYLDFQYETRRVESLDGFLQPYPAINYPDMFDYIRVHESKHLTGQLLPYSTLIYETTHKVKFFIDDTSKLCYPYFNSDFDAKLMRTEIKDLRPNVMFAGRMGLYQYIDMDEAVEQSMRIAKEINDG